MACESPKWMVSASSLSAPSLGHSRSTAIIQTVINHNVLGAYNFICHQLISKRRGAQTVRKLPTFEASHYIVQAMVIRPHKFFTRALLMGADRTLEMDLPLLILALSASFCNGYGPDIVGRS